VSYLSLKSLGSWVTDLVERLQFFGKWLEKGTMDSYWVSSFFFPQGFMTAALQTYARKNIIPIDTLVFRTNIREFNENQVKEIPEHGVNIHGLFVQGARFRKKIYEHFVGFYRFYRLEPLQIKDHHPGNVYKCPVYKTSQRAGELSTTGHSTNFVLYLDLNTTEEADHWVRRGVALLCQLDD